MHSGTRLTVFLRSLALVSLALSIPLATSGCGDDQDVTSSGQSSTSAPGKSAAATALETHATVIDVRTRSEYDAGHIAEAQLIDVQQPSFDTDIASLDKSRTYVVYCRSGNRSAAATARMHAVGLKVLDGGAMSAMVDAGWPTA